MKLNKKNKALKEKLDLQKHHSITEALEILKSNTRSTFDESLDVVVRLGIDPKQSDQMVRGVVSLPNGTGKLVRVAVFARDAKADEAKQAGADIVGAESLVDSISEGTINFDRCVATPDMMPLIAKVAKILGPKGLMPNPKLGTVTMNIKNTVDTIKSGQVEYRAEKAGLVHASLGKVSFAKDDLIGNIKAFFDELNKAKPSSSKGVFIVNASISSTMGIGLKIDLNTVL